MKKTSNIVLVIALAVFATALITGTAAAKNTLAATTNQANTTANEPPRGKPTEYSTPANKPAAATNGQSNTTTAGQANTSTNGRTIAIQKLTKAKLKVCQTKEAVIQRRDDALTKMANTMLTKFDSIAIRVETYYTSTVVPSGKTVSNYDALIADIATKKSTVRANLDKVSIDDTAFNCASNDPKGQLTQFRTNMQTIKQDLATYRTSIKNLIVAVRSVTGTTESSSNSTNSTTNQQ